MEVVWTKTVCGMFVSLIAPTWWWLWGRCDFQTDEITVKKPSQRIMTSRFMQSDEQWITCPNAIWSGREEQRQPWVGITLSYTLDASITDNGGKQSFYGLTTTDVINQIVIPQSLDKKCSHYDLSQKKRTRRRMNRRKQPLINENNNVMRKANEEDKKVVHLWNQWKNQHKTNHHCLFCMYINANF